MGNNSHGFSNESNIVEYLNDSSFCNINKNMQDFLTFVFGKQFLNNAIIKAGLTQKIERKSPKPDIWITIEDQTKYVSLKEGSGNSVHQEPLSEFCDYLKQNKISIDTIQSLKFYHYGDDTVDGTGDVRHATAQVKSMYRDKIQNANNELNKRENLVKILNRVLFAGSFKNPIVVDAIYHGTVQEGIYTSRHELIAYLLGHADPCNMSGIQFSELTYQPWTRDPNRSAAHPDRREVMQVKWGTMKRTIKIIEKERSNGK